MKTLKALSIGIATVIQMSYGRYLGQLHHSGPDIAGILLFLTGAAGLGLAIIIFRLTRKFSWHEKWYAKTIIGLAGCGIVFVLVFLYARWHG